MSSQSVFTRIKWSLIVIVLMIVEIGPIPFMGIICLYILLFRPLWFKRLVERIYS